MSKKLTKGWAVYRPDQNGLEESWFYTGGGAPYKRRGDAAARMELLASWGWTVNLVQISMFYEPDNG